MNNHNSTYLGRIFELRTALKTAEGEQIEQILDASDEAERLSEVIRNALCNYVKELPGVSHTENSVIWGVPILFRDGLCRFISEDNALVEVIDASTRLRMRKYFGAEYSVTTLGAVVPLSILGCMPISEHAQLFGVLAGDATRSGVKPVMTADEQFLEKLKTSTEPELAFMLGSMTRMNRMPVIKDKTPSEVKELSDEITGRMALHLNKFPEIGELVCGAPAAFPVAYEEGIKSLIDSLANKYTLGKPAVTCTSSNDFILRMTMLEHGARSVRELHLKRSILGMDGIKRLFDYADSNSCVLPASVNDVDLVTRIIH